MPGWLTGVTRSLLRATDRPDKLSLQWGAEVVLTARLVRLGFSESDARRLSEED